MSDACYPLALGPVRTVCMLDGQVHRQVAFLVHLCPVNVQVVQNLKQAHLLSVVVVLEINHLAVVEEHTQPCFDGVRLLVPLWCSSLDRDSS